MSTDGKKKSKFKFKNGLKSLKKSVTKNDTVQHFTGNDNNNNNNNNNNGTNITSTSNSSYFDEQQKARNGKGKGRKRTISLGKKKKIEKPRLPRLKLSEYTFPTQILPPSESWGDQQFDDEDKEIYQFIKTKYQNEIHKLKFFPSDILLRFTISQRGLTPFSERRKETELHFKKYLKYHADYNYDDILTNEELNCNKSLSSLKVDIQALPLFIYGQDKEGHPIFWDDGSAYSKDAELGEFKTNPKRVCLFRSRLMKKMHNVKLAASKKYGKMIYKHCLVMDLDKFNSKKFIKDRKFHEQNTKDISDLFPEVLHKLYVINAPWAFRSAWKVIQTFLHPITVEKTKILGKDYMDELQKDINLDMIPYKFGGIGPWDISFGEVPLGYHLETKDIQFDYTQLPKNTLPVPKRPDAPDMNKHRAKQQKQMKMSGIQELPHDHFDDEKKENIHDDNDNDNDDVQAPMDNTTKSQPVSNIVDNNNNNNNNGKQGVGDQ